MALTNNAELMKHLKLILQGNSMEEKKPNSVKKESSELLHSGDTRGPFKIKKIGSESSEGENQITLMDQLGQSHHYEVESSEPLLKRIKPVGDPREANCVIIYIDNRIQILMTKDIGPDESLLATLLPQKLPSTSKEPVEIEKKYPCTLCNSVKFSCFENLNAHQKYHCAKRTETASPTEPIASTSSPSMPIPSVSPFSSPFSPFLSAMGMHMMPAMHSLPNVLFLPMAIHDQPQNEIVQLLGPPQTILPVAVGRNAASMMNPILIQKSLCASLSLPSTFQYKIGQFTGNIPIFNIEGSPLPSTSGLKRPFTRSPSTPLDLTKRQRQESNCESPGTSQKPSASSDIEKPFACSCGISFSAESTLLAHRKHYCKDVERPDEPREPQRKLPSRCSQCDFTPHSLSQLSVHVRNVHNEVQAYLCKVCGYRGYSLRGIRSHVRSHPDLDKMKIEQLLETHVTRIKSDRKTPSDD